MIRWAISETINLVQFRVDHDPRATIQHRLATRGDRATQRRALRSRRGHAAHRLLQDRTRAMRTDSEHLVAVPGVLPAAAAQRVGARERTRSAGAACEPARRAPHRIDDQQRHPHDRAAREGAARAPAPVSAQLCLGPAQVRATPRRRAAHAGPLGHCHHRETG